MPGEKGKIPPQLQPHIDGMRANKEAREQALTEAEGAVASENPSEQLEEMASALPGGLGDLFLELKRATEGKDAEAALAALSRVFSNLPAETVARLRETAAFKSMTARAEASRRDRKPGDPIRNDQGKIIGYESWRREDFEAEEKVVFIGEENLVFFVNSIRWEVGEGIKTQLPASIYHYYMENRQERRLAASGRGAYEYLERASGGKVIRG